MRKTMLFWIAAGLVLAPSGAANAQLTGAAPPAPTGPAPGTVDSRDVMAASRERDAAYNQLAGRGVKFTDQDRVNTRTKRVSAVPATTADFQAGAQVRDIKGVPVGTIAILGPNEVVADPSQTVIDTGHAKIGVPLSAFGKDDKGLLLSITAENFNQLVAQANTKAPTPEPQTK